jgi:hypothetical protein
LSKRNILRDAACSQRDLKGVQLLEECFLSDRTNLQDPAWTCWGGLSSPEEDALSMLDNHPPDDSYETQSASCVCPGTHFGSHGHRPMGGQGGAGRVDGACRAGRRGGSVGSGRVYPGPGLF